MEDTVYDRLYGNCRAGAGRPKPAQCRQPHPEGGQSTGNGFHSVEHRIPLQSLDNAFDWELKAWHERLLKVLD